jgi:hypothetical protein
LPAEALRAKVGRHVAQRELRLASQFPHSFRLSNWLLQDVSAMRTPTPQPPRDQIRQHATSQDHLDELRQCFDAARNCDRRRLKDRRQQPREAPDRRRPTP